jgi:hypothetical protein
VHRKTLWQIYNNPENLVSSGFPADAENICASTKKIPRAAEFAKIKQIAANA